MATELSFASSPRQPPFEEAWRVVEPSGEGVKATNA
jgi:hypothetical protein